MAKIEPGVYEPRGDDIRVFDGAEDDLDDEGSRLPLLIVIALLVLAAFAGVVYLAYTEGVQKGHSESPRVITAGPGPAKVAPTDAGGTVTPYKGLKIYEQPAPSDEDNADTATPPPSEAPAAKSTAPAAAPFVQAKPEPAAPALKTATLQPAPAKTASPVPATPAATAKSVPAPAPTKPTPVAEKKTPAAETVKASQRVATAPPKSLAPPVTAPVKASQEAAVTAPKASTPPTLTPKAKPEEPKVKPEETKIVPAPVAAAPAAAPPASNAGYVIQIGSYKSEADATTAFNTFKSRNATLMSGFSPNIKKVDLGAKGTWYRLRVGSFPDRDAASAVCGRLGGGCLPARP